MSRAVVQVTLPESRRVTTRITVTVTVTVTGGHGPGAAGPKSRVTGTVAPPAPAESVSRLVTRRHCRAVRPSHESLSHESVTDAAPAAESDSESDSESRSHASQCDTVTVTPRAAGDRDGPPAGPGD